MSSRKVCITGFAESSRELANFEPPDVEVWGLNRCYSFLKRWDRWFELHDEDTYRGRNGKRDAQYMDMLKQSKVPVYMLQPEPEIPGVVLYPRAEIVARWRDYFTSSIAYMLALALYEGYKEIHLTGIEMASFSEYANQRNCIEYWLGVADGLGVKCRIPDTSPILKAPVYGVDNVKGPKAIGQKRLKQFIEEQVKKAAEINGILGCISELRQSKDMLPSDYVKERRKVLNDVLVDSGNQLNGTLGKIQEGQFWLGLLAANQTLEERPAPMAFIGNWVWQNGVLVVRGDEPVQKGGQGNPGKEQRQSGEQSAQE
jgi:hypothetical protein